jgi:hypothetical protein
MEKSFPFWSAALAVAAGTLIANAVTWFVAETRLRYELREVERAMVSQVRRIEAADKPQLQQSPRTQAAQSAAKPDRRPPYFQPARVGLDTGTVACLRGSVVRREDNGWSDVLDGNGGRLPCRDVR